MTATRRVLPLAPGLVLCGGIALVATGAAWASPAAVPVSAVLVAVLLGLLVGNLADESRFVHASTAGARYAARRVLRVGIVLLGTQLGLAEVAAVGGSAAVLVVVCMTLALVGVAALGALLGVPGRTRLLVAVGTAVCGNTAIMATAPVVDAEEREIGYAIGTITLLGTLGLLLFPVVGRLMGMGDVAFGLWAGLAINDTSQVVAAAAAYSDPARDVATVVKLFRNALMAPMLVVIAFVWARRADRDRVWSGVRQSFPVFIFGFLALTAARTAGVLPQFVVEHAGTVASVAITVAIAGVGLTTRFASIRTVGPRPLVAGSVATVLVALAAFVLAGRFGS